MTKATLHLIDFEDIIFDSHEQLEDVSPYLTNSMRDYPEWKEGDVIIDEYDGDSIYYFVGKKEIIPQGEQITIPSEFPYPKYSIDHWESLWDTDLDTTLIPVDFSSTPIPEIKVISITDVKSFTIPYFDLPDSRVICPSTDLIPPDRLMARIKSAKQGEVFRPKSDLEFATPDGEIIWEVCHEDFGTEKPILMIPQKE